MAIGVVMSKHDPRAGSNRGRHVNSDPRSQPYVPYSDYEEYTAAANKAMQVRIASIGKASELHRAINDKAELLRMEMETVCTALANMAEEVYSDMLAEADVVYIATMSACRERADQRSSGGTGT